MTDPLPLLTVPPTLGMLPGFTTGSPQQVAALFMALAKAQGDFIPISKNQTARIRPKDQSKTPYSFNYADLAEVIACTRPALAANGLAIVQPLVANGDFLLVQTWLLHEGGGAMFTECGAPSLDVPDLKEFGGQYNYLRRYQMQGLLGVASEEDVDADTNGGDGAHSGGDDISVGTPPAERGMARKAAPPGAPIDKGSLAWIERKVKALSMDAGMITAMFGKLKLAEKPWAQLTAEEFAAVKSELTKASAL